jgi:hypothetical protein
MKKLDLNQLAKRIVDQATGEAPAQPAPPEKNKAAQELGRLGGLKGGAARAKKLNPEQRSEIAKKAARSRWGKATESTVNGDEEETVPQKKRGAIPSPDF